MGAGEAWEVFKNTFPALEKYLYKLFRRRRSAYIHLFGAGEAGEAGEVFIYTVPIVSVEYIASRLLTALSECVCTIVFVVVIEIITNFCGHCWPIIWWRLVISSREHVHVHV